MHAQHWETYLMEQILCFKKLFPGPVTSSFNFCASVGSKGLTPDGNAGNLFSGKIHNKKSAEYLEFPIFMILHFF